jgi:polyhydroxybutyrate depolymerase
LPRLRGQFRALGNFPQRVAPLDLVSTLAGTETTVTRYTDACSPGGSGELWTIQAGVHVPSLTASYARSVVEYFYAHPKPAAAPPVPMPPGAALAVACLLGAAAIAAARLRR